MVKRRVGIGKQKWRVDDEKFLSQLNKWFGVVSIRYIYVLRDFEDFKSKSLNEGIRTILKKNKIAFEGEENSRQCNELIYHGIICDTENYGIMSLYDIIHERFEDDDLKFKIWNNKKISSIVDEPIQTNKLKPKQWEITIKDNDKVREILCMLINWSSCSLWTSS